MRKLLTAMLAATLASGAAAQSKLYQVRLPDGRILFTDQPPPGATIIGERAMPAPTPAAPAPAAPANARDRAASADEKRRVQAAQRDKAAAELSAAERELEQAKQNLEQGRVQGEGDRIGTAKGGSRLSPAYHDRVAKLEKAVAAAEDKVAKARDAVNALP
jgi:hypothetical protein